MFQDPAPPPPTHTLFTSPHFDYDFALARRLVINQNRKHKKKGNKLCCRIFLSSVYFAEIRSTNIGSESCVCVRVTRTTSEGHSWATACTTTKAACQ